MEQNPNKKPNSRASIIPAEYEVERQKLLNMIDEALGEEFVADPSLVALEYASGWLDLKNIPAELGDEKVHYTDQKTGQGKVTPLKEFIKFYDGISPSERHGNQFRGVALLLPEESTYDNVVLNYTVLIDVQDEKFVYPRETVGQLRQHFKGVSGASYGEDMNFYKTYCPIFFYSPDDKVNFSD